MAQQQQQQGAYAPPADYATFLQQASATLGSVLQEPLAMPPPPPPPLPFTQQARADMQAIYQNYLHALGGSCGSNAPAPPDSLSALHAISTSAAEAPPQPPTGGSLASSVLPPQLLVTAPPPPLATDGMRPRGLGEDCCDVAE